MKNIHYLFYITSKYFSVPLHAELYHCTVLFNDDFTCVQWSIYFISRDTVSSNQITYNLRWCYTNLNDEWKMTKHPQKMTKRSCVLIHYLHIQASIGWYIYMYYVTTKP